MALAVENFDIATFLGYIQARDSIRTPVIWRMHYVVIRNSRLFVVQQFDEKRDDSNNYVAKYSNLSVITMDRSFLLILIFKFH